MSWARPPRRRAGTTYIRLTSAARHATQSLDIAPQSPAPHGDGLPGVIGERKAPFGGSNSCEVEGRLVSPAVDLGVLRLDVDDQTLDVRMAKRDDLKVHRG